MKQVGVTRVSEAEMTNLIKRPTMTGVAVAGKSGGLTPAQILAQAGLQAQQPGQVAALVKTASGQHLPLTLPQVLLQPYNTNKM